MTMKSITFGAMFVLIGTLGAMTGCATVESPDTANTPETLLAREVALAHGVRAWNDKQVLKSDLAISFGGNQVLVGTMWFHVHDGRCRIERADGVVLVFDGNDAWVSPSDAEAPRARFHLLTWPYFVAAPMKLADPGFYLQMLHATPPSVRWPLPTRVQLCCPVKSPWRTACARGTTSR